MLFAYVTYPGSKQKMVQFSPNKTQEQVLSMLNVQLKYGFIQGYLMPLEKKEGLK